MPLSEITATSVVPPPMSMIMLPEGSATGTRAPIAAASGSLIRNALRAPACKRGVAHGAPFDAGHSGRNADHHLGSHQREATAALVDEVAQHLLGDDVVGDHAVAHRADDFDRLARLATEHVARFEPDRFDFAVFSGDRDDGRLVDDDAAPAHKDEDVGRPEIDADLFGHAVALRIAAEKSPGITAPCETVPGGPDGAIVPFAPPT